jgi:integrase
MTMAVGARLSALKVKALAKTGRYADGNGLYLQVSQNHAKSWLFRFMRDGVARQMGLGSAAVIPLAEARARAIECRRLVADGHDPIVHRDAQHGRQAEGRTFSDVMALYLKGHEGGWKNAKHRQQWRNTLDTYALPILGAMSVAAITASDVLRVLTPIWQDKTETASRLRGRIEAILSYAKALGWRQGENPAAWKDNLAQLLPAKARVSKVEHHAALPWREVPTFMRDLHQRDGAAGQALRLLILTASRTSETLGARWCEFDLTRSLWIIPPDRMKGGREHRVPLSPDALAVLARLGSADTKPNTFVFPGVKEGKPLSNMALLMLLRRMGRGDLTAHGFRSAFRDWASEATDHPNEAAEMALAHVVGDKVEAAYRRGDLFGKRIALMADWAIFCGSSVDSILTSESPTV